MTGTVEYYAERLRQHVDNRDRRSAFIGVAEYLADDTLTDPATTVARLRNAVAALRLVESEGR